MAVVRVEGLEKVFGRVRALDGLSFSVEPGMVFGFLGPNGAGKTTTLRILTGLARPSGGRAWVAGLESNVDRRAVASRIGYLPEEPTFYPWMTPRELLDYVGRLFRMNGQERAARAAELLETVGLAEVTKRRIGTFSRGMRQRMGLAQALLNRPEVLFLDEPVSALDPAGRKQVLELIARLHGQCAIVMSTHILADVERVCDVVGIIARGKMVVEASREELIARYAVPACELEGENGSAARMAAWAESLRTRTWAIGVTVSGTTVRVDVSDTALARRELLAEAAQIELPLTRYEVVRPSLEDVFLRLVSAGEERQ